MSRDATSFIFSPCFSTLYRQSVIWFGFMKAPAGRFGWGCSFRTQSMSYRLGSEPPTASVYFPWLSTDCGSGAAATARAGSSELPNIKRTPANRPTENPFEFHMAGSFSKKISPAVAHESGTCRGRLHRISRRSYHWGVDGCVAARPGRPPGSRRGDPDPPPPPRKPLWDRRGIRRDPPPAGAGDRASRPDPGPDPPGRRAPRGPVAQRAAAGLGRIADRPH